MTGRAVERTEVDRIRGPRARSTRGRVAPADRVVCGNRNTLAMRAPPPRAATFASGFAGARNRHSARARGRCDTRARVQTRRSRAAAPRGMRPRGRPAPLRGRRPDCGRQASRRAGHPGRTADGWLRCATSLRPARGAPRGSCTGSIKTPRASWCSPRPRAAHRALCAAFEARTVAKTYVALAFGDLPGARTVELPLTDARRGKARPGGAPASRASRRAPISPRSAAGACPTAWSRSSRRYC